MSETPRSARSKFVTLAGRMFPSLEERAYRRSRNLEIASLTETGKYVDRLRGVGAGRTSQDRPTHIVIIPMHGPSSDTWKPAGGNFFYEIAQSCREYAGSDKVSVFEVLPGEPSVDWHERLIRFVIDNGATHVMGQIETDPNPPNDQTWDVLWEQLSTRWDGVFLGVMFDSAFRIITLIARRIAAVNNRFVVVDICMPMDSSMKKGRPEVGPVNMPISNETLEVLDLEVGAPEQIHDVSFIGALYPYRVELIDTLRSHGVDVVVNPHRPDETVDFLQSRTNQPTYVDYMRGLASSKMTINFSISSSLNGQQLKTRVLEASSMGCLVLTDDRDRSDRFWVPGDEIAFFSRPQEVPALVEGLLAEPDRLAGMQTAGKARARSINVTSFWGGIDAGLLRRGLRRISD